MRLVLTLLGACLGFLLCWAGAMQPDMIRQMLLLQDAYLYLMMFSAIAVGMVGLRLLRGAGFRALATGGPVTWSMEPPQRRHVGGAVIFGLGWSIADACPGPIAGQLGLGNPWSVCTALGVLAGVELYLRRSDRQVHAGATQPATVEVASPATTA
jgi:uncharacterized membrane protein YedE/YeeE